MPANSLRSAAAYLKRARESCQPRCSDPPYGAADHVCPLGTASVAMLRNPERPGWAEREQAGVRKARELLAKTALWLLLLASVAGCAGDELEVQRNLSYDERLGIYGSFDLYEPLSDSRTDRPALLVIHGGAWRTGDKAWGEQIAEEFTPFGYVVFSINYRLSDEAESNWPAQIEDVQKALRYIRANAQRFRIDPERVASLGMSAGGHLATMVALREDPLGEDGRVDVAVNLDGEHDMTMPPEKVMDDFESIMTDVLGPPPWSAEELRGISTTTFARPGVSLLTVHGEGDTNVYVAQGERITAALQGAGAEPEFVRLTGREGDCHSDCWRVPVATEAIHRFLERTLSHDGRAFLEAQQQAGSQGE